MNGDGYDDVIVGAQGRSELGSAYLFPGSAGGLGVGVEITASDGVADDSFGIAVAGVGDVDGDGYDDVLVGASGADDNGASAGAAYLFPGGAAGLDSDREHKLLASDGYGGDRFGYAVASAGDRDGDGYTDVLVGAYGDDDGGSGSGAAYLFPGSAKGVVESAEVKLLASDAAADDGFGLWVAGAGDLNGDGADDLTVGAPDDDDLGTSSGAAYLFYGECTAVSTFYADADGDGYGDSTVSAESCGAPEGHVADASDCDDADASVYPGAPELAGDGVDQDCDGEDLEQDTGDPVDDTGGPPQDTDDSAPPQDSDPPSDSEPAADDTGPGPADTGTRKEPSVPKGCTSAGGSPRGMLLSMLCLPTMILRRRC